MRFRLASLIACFWVCPVAAEQGRLSAGLIEATPERAVAEGDVELRWSGHRFLAERLVVMEAADDALRFQATNFVWTPCGCEVAPWALSGRSAEGVLDDHLVIRRGAFRVCDVPVLPVPVLRLSLNERSPRLLIPEVRSGETGTVVGLPVWLPIGREGHAVVTSEWWSQRWLRQRVQLNVPLGEADVAMAKDGPMSPFRGQADVRGGQDDGTVQIAADVAWSSDIDVRSDYGAGFIDRNSLFDERLLLAGVGPFRLESDTFDRGDLQRPVSAAVSFGGVAVGPSSLSTYGRVDTMQDHERVRQQAAAGAEWSLGLSGDWTDIEAHGLVEAAQADDAEPYARAGLGGSVGLATWSDFSTHRIVSQSGLKGWVDAAEGVLDDPFGLVGRRPQWAVGPSHRSQWVSASGVPLRWSAAFLWTDEGWRPEGILNIDHQGIGGAIHADTNVQAGMVGLLGEEMDAQVGVMRDDTLLQGIMRASVMIATHWRPGWSGMYDFKSQHFVRQGPSLTWDPGCGCLTANVGVEWAQDLELPSVMLRLDLHARQPADR